MAVNDMAVSNPQTTRAGRRHLGWVLGLASTAYFMVVLDSVVVTTALPRMQRDLHAGRHARASIALNEPAERTAPGQLACLYAGDLVVGHGTIAA